MSFTAQLPGSLTFNKNEFHEEMPSAGGIKQQSCYSFVEKISGIANPVGLLHDTLYPNSFAATFESENETPAAAAAGCVGHQPNKEFPLESKTPFPLPLVMFPTQTNGRTLECVDLCAKPVLNWEEYIQDLKTPFKKPFVSRGWKPRQGKSEKSSQVHEKPLEVVIEAETTEDSVLASTGNETSRTKKTRVECDEKPMKDRLVKRTPNIILTRRARKLLADKDKQQVKPCEITRGNSPDLPLEDDEWTDEDNKYVNPDTKGKEKKLTMIALMRLKNQPKLRVEGTWNHLFGGYNGACCFVNDSSSTNLNLYVGKGSQLRAIQLKQSQPSSIFSYSIESIWDSHPHSPMTSSGDNDPFNDQILQIIPNQRSKLLGVRRGRSIQIFDSEEPDGGPVLLDTIPNTLYGTSNYYQVERKISARNPLFRGIDFNPTFSPEIISIDENLVIRVCNMVTRSISDQFALPSVGPFGSIPDKYPEFKVNDAAGISFTNFGQIFYAWGNSVVYMGDRRSTKYSREHITPLFDLRRHAHSLAISDQNHFHDKSTKLNEYMSCVRRSKNDNYYYVGTSAKIYLMDIRVPNYPVIMVNHGLQSPLAYMDVSSDDGGNFETIVAASQRMSETVCMISDMVHMECGSRSGCKSRNPLLYGYPRHLQNPRSYFDGVLKEGYDFPLPKDHQQIKEHFYAWSTGIATYPIRTKDKTTMPGGVLVASCNNFGDVFWEEWDQKPLPTHRRISLSDYKLKNFVTDWHKAMKVGLAECDPTQKQSKNPKEPVDCTIFIEPLAKEIENLSRVRESSFDCFKPSQVQNHASLKSLLLLEDMCEKLSNYKSPQVKDMLAVWQSSENEIPQTVELEGDEVQVKEEPVEPGQLSPTNTIDLDGDLSQIELEIQSALNIDDEYSGLFTQNFPMDTGQGSTAAYQDTENFQFYNPEEYDTQEVALIRLSSSKYSNKTKKIRRSGFL